MFKTDSNNLSPKLYITKQQNYNCKIRLVTQKGDESIFNCPLKEKNKKI